MVDQGNNKALAAQIADEFTNRTGRIWDHEAMDELAVWLHEPDHHAQAMQWLSYLSTETPASPLDPMKEFNLRRPLHDVLAGMPSLASDTEDRSRFILRHRRWWPWRRRN